MNMDSKEAAIARVARMEEVYDSCSQAMAALIEAAGQYLAREQDLRALEGYYTGPEWIKDHDAERQDFFPKDMKRGILTEDAIWDLLTDEVRMKGLLEKILRTEA